MASFSAGIVLDRAEIRESLIRERYYRDFHEWDNLRSMYHPDASKTRINVAWHDGTIDTFVEGSKTSPRSVIHLVTPQKIDVRGTKAIAVSACHIHNRHEAPDGQEYELQAWLRLITRHEKISTPDGPEWKILTLDAIYIRDMLVPVSPAPGTHNLDLSLAKNARKSYRHLAWNVRANGKDVRDDMPGEDDEVTVRKVMDPVNQWFENDVA